MIINKALTEKLLNLTNSNSITNISLIQGVWGGYGQLLRITLAEGIIDSVILKQVNTPKPKQHPKGWNSNQSHQRKLISYNVESYWYQYYGQMHLDQDCYIPRCIFSEKTADQQLLILEDLTTAGFPIVKKSCSLMEAKTCISWLAKFHFLHLQRKPTGLWPTGSYWHLATRPDELSNLQDIPLKIAANKLDKLLSECAFQTLIHGDAKLANFCFSEDGRQVAAVDFQYVGAGCGMKDIILFISSAIAPEDCEEQAPLLVEHYFNDLRALALQANIEADELVSAWRPLYSIAWADFQRFIKGWSPDHWKINAYSESLTQHALGELDAIFSTTTQQTK